MAYISVSAVGTTVTTGATASAAAVIPNTGNGGRAKAVRIVSETSGHIKFGGSAVAATANDILVTSTPQIIWVAGFTHFSVIQNTAAAKINVIPVDA